MGYNHIPVTKKPTGNDFATFLKVADFDTVYRRVGKFESENWNKSNKPKIEKNTPLSSEALSLLRDIYSVATIDQFITQFQGKPVETGENSEAVQLAQLKARHQNEIDRLRTEKDAAETTSAAKIEAAQKQLNDQQTANRQRISDLEARLKEKNDGQSQLTQALEGKNAATVTAAQQRIADLSKTTTQQLAEITQLRTENTQLETQRSQLTAQNTVNSQRISDLDAQIARYIAESSKMVSDAEAAAYDRAEADFLRKSDALVEARAQERLKQQAELHRIASREANQKYTQADTDHKRMLAEKDAAIAQLRGINQALEIRLKTTWGLWRLPTRLEIPPIMSLILAAIGLWKMLGFWFGIGLFVMLFVVYLEAMEVVKNPKYKKAATYLIIAVAVFECLFLVLHPTTVKLLFSEMLGDEGIAKLVFSESVMSYGISFLISATALACVWLNWIKTKDAAAL